MVINIKKQHIDILWVFCEVLEQFIFISVIIIIIFISLCNICLYCWVRAPHQTKMA